MLDKAALPDYAPTGQHSYKVTVPHTEGTVSVMVHLRGFMRTMHPNRQKTFHFKGVDDICHCWAQACSHGIDLYWLAPPPPRRAAAEALPLPGPAAAAEESVADVADVDPPVALAGPEGPRLYDGLPPAPGPGYRRVEPGDSSSSSSESDGDETDENSQIDAEVMDFMESLHNEANEEPVPEPDKKRFRRSFASDSL